MTLSHSSVSKDSLRLLLLILCTLAIIPTLFSSKAEANNSGVLFIPPKITTIGEHEELQKSLDDALFQSLTEKGIIYLERGAARQLVDYQAEWPPAVQQLAQRNELSATSYLALGILTAIGNTMSLDVQLYDLAATGQVSHITARGKSVTDLVIMSQNIARDITVQTTQESSISSIAPSGNKKIDSGAILKNIKTKPGDPYSPELLREDLKAIYSMGYFEDVQIEVTDSLKGKNVIFNVVEKPVITSILLSGTDELDEDKVREVLTLKEQSILNPLEMSKTTESIQQLYKTKGYYNTKVTPKVSFPSPETAEIRFVIDEGKKIYIKKIFFEGNTTFDDDELEDEIETDTKGWFSWLTDSGLLDYDQLNQDAGRIINFYGNQGFLEAKIGDPIIKQENEWLYITFVIEENTRFRVGTVDIQGDLLEDKETVLNMLELPKDEYISRKVLREDILKITDLYAEKGYANANVDPRVNRRKDSDILDITIAIEKGELVYINRINIIGNTRTRDNVIRRELEVKEGGVYNVKALRDSAQNLQYLQFFEEVNITPEKSFSDATMDITVEVKDKPTGQFTIGAGYSSVDHLILMGEIAENNFLGRGDTLALSAKVGGESDSYRLRYKNPSVNDSDLSLGLDLFDTSREYDDYTKDSKGGGISIGYPLWDKVRGYGSYSYTDTVLSDIDDDASYLIRKSADINVTSAVKLTIERNTLNRRWGASEGSNNSFSVRYAGGPFGGDSQFTKVEVSSSWYFPLFWSTVLHLNGVAGQAFENEDDSLPVYERFYLGGLRSIRGFDYAKISPKDPDTNDRIGGDKMWFTNIEYIFPLVAESGVNGVIFYDMGNVFNDDEDWSFSDYKKAVGLGIRWFSPIGPLRLEWGYNLDPQDDEDDSVWDFSIGGIF